jgi:hypothetical protein
MDEISLGKRQAQEPGALHEAPQAAEPHAQVRPRGRPRKRESSVKPAKPRTRHGAGQRRRANTLRPVLRKLSGGISAHQGSSGPRHDNHAGRGAPSNANGSPAPNAPPTPALRSGPLAGQTDRGQERRDASSNIDLESPLLATEQVRSPGASSKLGTVIGSAVERLKAPDLLRFQSPAN